MATSRAERCLLPSAHHRSALTDAATPRDRTPVRQNGPRKCQVSPFWAASQAWRQAELVVQELVVVHAAVRLRPTALGHRRRNRSSW
jgi:hypothetical protein